MKQKVHIVLHPRKGITVNLATIRVTKKELQKMETAKTGEKVDGSIYESTTKGWKRMFRIKYVNPNLILKERIKSILKN